MKRKVKIKALPAAQSGLEVKMAGLHSGLGFNSNALPWGKQAGEFSKPDTEVNSTLGPVPRHQANLEAEKGEVAMLPGKGGVPSTFKIGGNKHYDGGTPLNLPPDSFIYSDTKAMKIKDPEILKQFGIPAKTSGFTPADIAKKYDINAYKKVLADPDSDDLQRETAEGMIANYNLKLAKLALLQESKKGFPQGLPMVAMPYLEALQIDPSEFVQSPAMGEQTDVDNMQMSQYGGDVDYFSNTQRVRIKGLPKMKYGLPTAQDGKTITNAENYLQKQSAQDTKDLIYNQLYNEQLKKIDLEKVLAKKEALIDSYLEAAQDKVSPFNIFHPLAFESTAERKAALQKELNEYKALKKQYDDYVRKISVATRFNKANPALPESKPKAVTKVPIVETVNPALDTVGFNEALNFQKGGIVKEGPHSKGGTLTKYADGTVIWTKADGSKVTAVQGDPNWKPKAKPTAKPVSGKVSTPGSIDPYYDVEDIKPYLIDDTVLRDLGVDRAQHEIEKGTGVYGDKKIDVSTFLKNNPSWAKEFEKRHPGETFNPKNNEHVGEFQDFYNENLHNNIFKQAKHAGKTESQAKAIADKAVRGLGFDPNYKPGTGNPRGKDSKFGQYTSSRVELQFKDLEKQPEIKTQEEQTIPGDVTTQAEHLPPVHIPQGSPWWLQDIIKTAHAAGNLMRVKKYEPWQATADVVRPRVAFFDPNRELAANAEQSNIAAQTLAQFTGPQSFNARYNEVQGKGLARAADTISRVHNQNVDMSNRQEALNADMMNRASEQRAHQAATLWDKYQTVNQQFDNAKSQARDALVNQYVNAITNKNYTANLNKLYPQFAVNPAIGGEYYFHDPRALKPNFSQAPDLGQLYEDVLTKHPHLKETPNGDKIALDIAKQKAGFAPTNPYLDYQNRGVIPQYYPGFDQEE